MNENESRLPARGDSFDIGKFRQVGVTDPQEQNQLGQIMQNPSQLAQAWGLNDEQVKNLRSIIVGGGAGLIHKILAPYIGDELAGGAGGALGAFLAKKLLGGS
jgi:hypothetical protein